MIARTDAERDAALRVRVAVFVEEQGIPREEELDEADASAVHCVAYDPDAVPVGAGRLLLSDGYARIGRMAVLSSHRGHGLGRAILDVLECEGAARGVGEFRLSAQLHAARFYERAGYACTGDVYDEVGIPHVAMVKRLGAPPTH